MLPEIPDNESGRCWAPGCEAKIRGLASSTGLCSVHDRKTAGQPPGKVFDVLGMRLNVLQMSGGACLEGDAPCDLQICRYHLDDYGAGWNHQPRGPLPEPCAIKLANEGPQTLQAIADALCLTRERVRQLENLALWKVGKTGAESLGIAPRGRRVA